MSDYLKRRQEHIMAGRPLAEKKKYFIPKKSKKRIEKEKQQKQDVGESGLDKYFDYHMENSFPKCENCGMVAMWLKEEKYKSVWRMCHHHVLGKKKSIGGFPSVATRLENHLVLFPSLGGKLCGCHAYAESSWENLAKMSIFPKVIDIINILYPLLSAEEKRYLPEIIIQEIKPAIYNSK